MTVDSSEEADKENLVSIAEGGTRRSEVDEGDDSWGHERREHRRHLWEAVRDGKAVCGCKALTAFAAAAFPIKCVRKSREARDWDTIADLLKQR